MMVKQSQLRQRPPFGNIKEHLCCLCTEGDRAPVGVIHSQDDFELFSKGLRTGQDCRHAQWHYVCRRHIEPIYKVKHDTNV